MNCPYKNEQCVFVFLSKRVEVSLKWRLLQKETYMAHLVVAASKAWAGKTTKAYAIVKKAATWKDKKEMER
jgi:hypothetical protein